MSEVKNAILWTLAVGGAMFAGAMLTMMAINKSNSGVKYGFNKFQHDGHSYLRFEEHTSLNYDFSVVHDPDCKCSGKVSVPQYKKNAIQSPVFSGSKVVK